MKQNTGTISTNLCCSSAMKKDSQVQYHPKEPENNKKSMPIVIQDSLDFNSIYRSLLDNFVVVWFISALILNS